MKNVFYLYQIKPMYNIFSVLILSRDKKGIIKFFHLNTSNNRGVFLEVSLIILIFSPF